MDLFKPKKKAPTPDHAFPFNAIIPPDPTEGRLNATMIVQQGMTLRDWFAGQALGLIKIAVEGDQKLEHVDKLAREMYRIADALIAERGKNEDS